MSIIFNFLVATFFNGKKSEINFNIFISVYKFFFFFLGGGFSDGSDLKESIYNVET